MPPRRYYTDEEAAWVADEAPRSRNSVEMAARFDERFGRRLPPVTLRTYCRKHGIHAGWQGTRDRSPVHRTSSGKWMVHGVKMTDAQHDWWLAYGELPPRGTNVLRAPGGMRLATDAELLAINRLGLRWEDPASLEACISVAKVEVAKHRAIAANPAYARERRREYMRRYTAQVRKGKR